MVFFVLQVGGAVLKFDFSQFMAEPPPALNSARSIYQFLPPLGEMVFDLRHGFKEPHLVLNHTVLWAVWFGIFVCLFRWKIRMPAKYRSAEV